MWASITLSGRSHWIFCRQFTAASSDCNLDLRYQPDISSLLLDPVALDCSPPAASILETTSAGLGEGGACSSSGIWLSHAPKSYSCSSAGSQLGSPVGVVVVAALLTEGSSATLGVSRELEASQSGMEWLRLAKVASSAVEVQGMSLVSVHKSVVVNSAARAVY